jgi:hypothetical protein
MAQSLVHLAGRTLGEHRHVCAFFRSSDEEYRTLLPLIKDGLEGGEKALHVVDPSKSDDHRARLEAFGIKVNEYERSGAFELCGWNATYFPDGCFDQERTLAMWRMTFETARRLGNPPTRVVAHMEWALEKLPGVNDLIEYETRFNLIERHDNLVICAYDLTRFRADVIVDVIRSHPLIIVGGVLQENPFYIPPDRFLRELRERTPSAASRS